MPSEVIHLLASIINFPVKGLAGGESNSKELQRVYVPCQGLLSLLYNQIETSSLLTSTFFLVVFCQYEDGRRFPETLLRFERRK